MNRRKLLSTVGTAGALTLAGCIGGDGTEDDNGNNNGNGSDTGDENSTDEDIESVGPTMVTTDAEELSATAEDLEQWNVLPYGPDEMSEEQRQNVRDDFNRHGTIDTFDIVAFDHVDDDDVAMDQTLAVMETVEGGEEYFERNGGSDEGHITEDIGDELNSMLIEGEGEDEPDLFSVTARFNNVIVRTGNFTRGEQIPLEDRASGASTVLKAVEANVEEHAVPVEE